jgi:3-hydroxyisobutyrate dehydrogenase and related beta-hydroxyacid dehydrogenases
MKTANDTSSALERLGFIGLGNMGGAIALRLLRAGYPLAVLDLDDEKMQALKKNGAAVAATPKEIAERSTIVLASLQPGDVEKVTCGENGIAAANNEKLVFVDLSSTAPELAIKVSDSLRARGIEMLERR